MTYANPHAPEDAFLETFPGAMALDKGMRRGLIDRIALDGVVPVDALNLPAEAAFFPVLLERAGLVGRSGGALSLTDAFARVWPARRTALAHKLRFLKAVSVDLAMGMSDLVGDLPTFMKQAHTFDIFDYSHALKTDADALARTQIWCDYVAVLTETEAPEITAAIDLDPGARVLEVGGNVGVLASAIMTAFGAEVMVLDLPGVCELGKRRNVERASGARPTFVAGDARQGEWDELPGAPWDAVLFKSVLHDWPEDQRGTLLDHALAALGPGGQVIIAERGPLEAAGPLPYWLSADLVFAPFYRSGEWYAAALRARGCEVRQFTPDLGLPFHITVGVKT